MGLLDGVLGGAVGSNSQQGGGAAMLMQLVAALLANRGGGAAAGSGLGGLGGLGGLVAGAAGGGAAGGGLAGLAEQFQRGGLGDVMASWIGTGPNREIAPEQLGGVLGDDLVGQMTQQTGMERGDVLGQLSQLLPQMVDRATPEGRIPEGGLGDIGALLAQLDRGTGR